MISIDRYALALISTLVLACSDNVTVFGGDGGAGAGGATSTTTTTDTTTSSSAGGGGGTAMRCDPGETMECYTGPPNTERVGICHGGTTTCTADGSGWGPCEGEVTPSAEGCMTLADEGCDGVATSCNSGTTVWAKRFGDPAAGSNNTQFASLAIDALDNAVVTVAQPVLRERGRRCSRRHRRLR